MGGVSLISSIVMTTLAGSAADRLSSPTSEISIYRNNPFVTNKFDYSSLN